MTRFIFMKRDYTYIVTDRDDKFVSSHRRKDSAKQLVRKLNTMNDPVLVPHRPYKYVKEKTYR